MTLHSNAGPPATTVIPENRQLRVLELFSGTGSVYKVSSAQGDDVRSLDNDPRVECTYNVDFMNFDYATELVDWVPDIIWASPPCTEYSIAKRNAPRDIRKANGIVTRVLALIAHFTALNPNLIYFIENPQTGLLKQQSFMDGIPYSDVDYCQYGRLYRKRTRIWSNSPKLQTTPLRMCPGRGKCPSMEGNAHIVGLCTGKTKRRIGLQESHSIPADLLCELLEFQ